MKFKTMTAVSVLTLMMSFPAFADDSLLMSASGPRFTPRPDVPASQYSAADEQDDATDRRDYNAYEQREPCQHYRRIPRNSVEMSYCMVMKTPAAGAVGERMVTEQRHLLPIIHSETIYFDFDRSGIRANQDAMLDKVAAAIDTYKPADITVTGYTDRSGKASYNEKLSQRRAHTISEALRKRGVMNEEIDQQARGETDNAVATADGVRMPENRRVVVDFRR